MVDAKQAINKVLVDDGSVDLCTSISCEQAYECARFMHTEKTSAKYILRHLHPLDTNTTCIHFLPIPEIENESLVGLIVLGFRENKDGFLKDQKLLAQVMLRKKQSKKCRAYVLLEGKEIELKDIGETKSVKIYRNIYYAGCSPRYL